jgi:hypothetical protein
MMTLLVALERRNGSQPRLPGTRCAVRRTHVAEAASILPIHLTRPDLLCQPLKRRRLFEHLCQRKR